MLSTTSAESGLDPRAGAWRFVHDAAGRLTRRVDPTTLQQWVDYTPEGFVSRMRTIAPSQPGDPPGSLQIIESVDYADYDALGNPHSITTSEGTTTLAYDARSQVTAVAYPGAAGSEAFGYDLVGNRVRHVGRDGVARLYDVDAADQLTAIRDEASGTVLESFTHDAAGRRTARQVAGGETTTYDYDALGRLVGLEELPAGGGAASYTMTLAYDATGHRGSREDDTGTTRYFGEWSESRAGASFRLVHGGGIDRVVAEIAPAAQGGTVRTYLPDAAGNVTHVTDGSGLEPTPRRYEAFGALRTGSSVVPRGFAGRPTLDLAGCMLATTFVERAGVESEILGSRAGTSNLLPDDVQQDARQILERSGPHRGSAR